MLKAPLRWKRARHVFVNSMADVYHDDITNEQIATIFGVMAACPQHTFLVLTKRADRMLEWFRWAERFGAGYDLLRCGLPSGLLTCAWEACAGDAWEDVEPPFDCVTPDIATFGASWPLPNVWLGVSVEDQQRADERIPLLRQSPAALRWLSVEPLLGRVELDLQNIDWVVAGGESGPGARQCDRRWIADVVDQCCRAHVPVFLKQLGAAYCDTANAVGGAQTRSTPEYGPIRRLRDPKGANMDEWPPELRVRERPSKGRASLPGPFAATDTAALESLSVTMQLAGEK
jgi:protein gp37